MTSTPTAGDAPPGAPACSPDDVEVDEALAAATTDLHLDTARALVRLPYAFGDRLLPGHRDYPLVSRLTGDLVAAGFAVHDCDARERTGGVCLTPNSQEPGGVIVTWTTHVALALDPGRGDVHADVGLLMNFAIDDVLCVLGWQSEPFGEAGAHVVTGHSQTMTTPAVRHD